MNNFCPCFIHISTDYNLGFWDHSLPDATKYLLILPPSSLYIYLSLSFSLSLSLSISLSLILSHNLSFSISHSLSLTMYPSLSRSLFLFIFSQKVYLFFPSYYLWTFSSLFNNIKSTIYQ